MKGSGVEELSRDVVLLRHAVGAGKIASPQVSSRWCLDHNTSRPRHSRFWERTPGDGIAPAANFLEAWRQASSSRHPARDKQSAGGAGMHGWTRAGREHAWGWRCSIAVPRALSAQTAKRNNDLQSGSVSLRNSSLFSFSVHHGRRHGGGASVWHAQRGKAAAAGRRRKRSPAAADTMTPEGGIPA